MNGIKLISYMMSESYSIHRGETVQCSCPEGVVLPDGLPSGALAEVVAVYVRQTLVIYNGDEFTVPTACVRPIKVT